MDARKKIPKVTTKSKTSEQKKRKVVTEDDDEPIQLGRCVSVSDRYDKIGRIGAGTYGVVYKAIDKETNTIVALKRCIPHGESTDGFPLTTIREITALRFCASHPHIVQLLDVAVSRSSVFLVFEYYQHDLANLVSHHFAKHGKSPFSEAACKTLLLQLLDALKYLHEYDFIHRDLKLSNLLYDNGILRVADLGLSRLYMPQMTPRVASLWSRPPEVIMERPSVALPGINYGEVIDVWAVGCVWTELLRGQPLSRAQTELEQVQHILEWIPRDAPYLLRAHRDWFNREKMGDGEISWPKRSNRILDEFPFLSKEGIRLLCNLFQCDPSKRWKVKQAISSSYFQEEPLPTPVESMPYFLDISE